MTAKIWIADDEPSRRFPVYTRGNVGEVFPEVVAPLTWSAAGPAAESGWRKAFAEFGAIGLDEYGDDAKVILGVFGGYCYLNISVSRVFAVRTPGLTVEAMDRTIYGESDAPPYQARPGDKNLVASLKVAGTLLRSLRAKSLPRLEKDRAAVAAWIAGLPDPRNSTDQQLIDCFTGYLPLFERLFQTHILTSFQATVGPGVLAQICDSKLGDATLTNTLLAGLGSVESAAPSVALWSLGRQVAADAALSAAFDDTIDDRLEERLAHDPEMSVFRDGFTRFLEEFGSRGPNEWEFGADTWGTKPRLVLSAIDRMRVADPSHDPRVQHDRLQAERLTATAAARARLKGPARVQFDLALRSSQLFSQGRERSKSTVIRATHAVRLRLRELARRARDRGGPPELRDMFLVTIGELGDYVAEPGRFAEVLGERRALRDRLAGLVPPFVFDGTQPSADTWASRGAAVRPAAAGTTLTGIAGCPGVARGRARVVLDPLDPRQVGPGHVLVAPITDPSWTPLFVPAEAVVVDVGAQMSHAVIVSRELGIPAVVSVTDATRVIPDGAMIEVDGSRGVVRILES